MRTWHERIWNSKKTSTSARYFIVKEIKKFVLAMFIIIPFHMQVNLFAILIIFTMETTTMMLIASDKDSSVCTRQKSTPPSKTTLCTQRVYQIAYIMIIIDTRNDENSLNSNDFDVRYGKMRREEFSLLIRLNLLSI